jgi:hypothetical protein
MVVHAHILSMSFKSPAPYLQLVVFDRDDGAGDSGGAVVLVDEGHKVLLWVVTNDADVVLESAARRRDRPLHGAGFVRRGNLPAETDEEAI